MTDDYRDFLVRWSAQSASTLYPHDKPQHPGKMNMDLVQMSDDDLRIASAELLKKDRLRQELVGQAVELAHKRAEILMEIARREFQAKREAAERDKVDPAYDTDIDPDEVEQEYITCRKNHLDDLGTDVTRFLKDGWVPYGSPYVFCSEVCQAMTRIRVPR